MSVFLSSLSKDNFIYKKLTFARFQMTVCAIVGYI